MLTFEAFLKAVKRLLASIYLISIIIFCVQTFVKALIMLRNKGLIQATTVLELFFRLFRCQDKLLRKTISNYIINDIKNINSKHKNLKLNTVCTSIFFSFLVIYHYENNYMVQKFAECKSCYPNAK